MAVSSSTQPSPLGAALLRYVEARTTEEVDEIVGLVSQMVKAQVSPDSEAAP